MMTSPVHSLACRTRLTFSDPLVFCVLKVRQRSFAAPIDTYVVPGSFSKEEIRHPETEASYGKGDNVCKAAEWKKLDSEELGIRNSMIAKPTRWVLNGLKKQGYEVYLVGGCVRDLILKRTPKDFDIITSAALKEVKRAFPRCEIVGKRFPICHVHVDDMVVEVSSFSTSGRNFGRESYRAIRRPPKCSDADFIRWRNCLRRDFTINGLMFDPFQRIVYDYTGGLEDIQRAKVRSVIPASTSFTEDCARILRGVRIGARLGFHFAKETSYFIKELAFSVLRLDKGRILMEMNYMMAYGSAEASLRLLWRFGLLELLLPIQAEYFATQGFRRRDKRSNMLLCLFATLDDLLAPDQPCPTSLWIAILAFHKALVDRPRDPLVVGAFGVAIYSGGMMNDAIHMVRKISLPHDPRFHELSENSEQHLESNDAVSDEVFDLATDVKIALNKMSDEHFVSQALVRYPKAPQSDLVFISPTVSEKARDILECITKGKKKGSVAKRARKTIDYESLATGRLQEVRQVFARVVFDTVYPPILKTYTNSKDEKCTK